MEDPVPDRLPVDDVCMDAKTAALALFLFICTINTPEATHGLIFTPPEKDHVAGRRISARLFAALKTAPALNSVPVMVIFVSVDDGID